MNCELSDPLVENVTAQEAATRLPLVSRSASRKMTRMKGKDVMRRLVLAGVFFLIHATIATAVEPLTKASKPVVPQRSIPLAGEEPYEALKRGDYRVAAGLFSPRAEKGDVRAQYNLGLLYASGMGVMQDYQAALKWHRLAAGQGHAGAQNELAQIYAKGQGVQQDQVRAYVWYSVAGESSTGGSKTEIIKDRDHMAKRMTPNQIQKAEGLTKQCLESQFKKCGEK
jgi:Sel1 repeat